MLPKMSVASPISNMYLMGIPMASNKTYEIPSIIVINRNHPIAVENTSSSPYCTSMAYKSSFLSQSKVCYSIILYYCADPLINSIQDVCLKVEQQKSPIQGLGLLNTLLIQRS